MKSKSPSTEQPRHLRHRRCCSGIFSFFVLVFLCLSPLASSEDQCRHAEYDFSPSAFVLQEARAQLAERPIHGPIYEYSKICPIDDVPSAKKATPQNISLYFSTAFTLGTSFCFSQPKRCSRHLRPEIHCSTPYLGPALFVIGTSLIVLPACNCRALIGIVLVRGDALLSRSTCSTFRIERSIYGMREANTPDSCRGQT